MMRRALYVLLAVACVASLASSAMAADWYKVGTSAFTTTQALNIDSSRIKFNSVAADDLGNVYATATNGNNNGMAGGFTIYKADGSKIDVDLNATEYKGGITKFVKGGDGSIYALQNWMEINWSYNSGVPNRILKVGADGSLSQVWGFANAADANRIGGMTVGGDGNIYWTTNGADGYYKYHFFWRYDVASGTVEEAPINVSNNGWSENHRMYDLEYVGDGKFAVVKSGGAEWRADLISWTENRVLANISNPGWGRDHVTALAYDPVQNRLWAGGRGGSNRNIMSRWNDPVGQGGSDVWHALNSDADLGARWWVSGMDTDAAGDAWMGFNIADPLSDLLGYRGHVVRRDGFLNMYDEGAPEEGADICAIAAANGGMYALVLNNMTGEYNLYTTVVPEPGSLLALGTGLIGLAGLIRRRK